MPTTTDKGGRFWTNIATFSHRVARLSSVVQNVRMTTLLQIIKPDDWHIHLRDGTALPTTVAHCAGQFARAIVMPNLNPPVCTVSDALSYRKRIMENVPGNTSFTPLMTLYLTDHTTEQDIRAASANTYLFAAKLYPAHATTGAQFGVTDMEKLHPVWAAMQECGFPLLVHGEVTDPAVDVFDREAVFIDRVLAPLVKQFPELPVVFEHITTEQAVQFVRDCSHHVAATITAHHLWINRNAMFQGGIRPHHYCLPVAKREKHRLALIEAATGGESKFFLGTDSAPHSVARKETACGCAGIYTAHAAIELYAEIFDNCHALDKLEAFASISGPQFYRLPANTEKITLAKQSWRVPDAYPYGGDCVIPFRAGQTLSWQSVNT